MKTKVFCLAVFAVLALVSVINFIFCLCGNGWAVFNFENGNVLALVIAFWAGGGLSIPFMENRSSNAFKLLAAPFVAILIGVVLVWLWNGNLIAEYNSVYDFFTNLESSRIRANHSFEALWDASVALQQMIIASVGWLFGVAFMAIDRTTDVKYA
jgi:hypothetical protein